MALTASVRDPAFGAWYGLAELWDTGGGDPTDHADVFAGLRQEDREQDVHCTLAVAGDGWGRLNLRADVEHDVVLEAHDSQPATGDLDDWEEVVETPVRLSGRGVHLVQVTGGPTVTLDLPGGPGLYRLQVSRRPRTTPQEPDEDGVSPDLGNDGADDVRLRFWPEPVVSVPRRRRGSLDGRAHDLVLSLRGDVTMAVLWHGVSAAMQAPVEDGPMTAEGLAEWLAAPVDAVRAALEAGVRDGHLSVGSASTVGDEAPLVADVADPPWPVQSSYEQFPTDLPLHPPLWPPESPADPLPRDATRPGVTAVVVANSPARADGPAEPAGPPPVAGWLGEGRVWTFRDDGWDAVEVYASSVAQTAFGLLTWEDDVVLHRPDGSTASAGLRRVSPPVLDADGTTAAVRLWRSRSDRYLLRLVDLATMTVTEVPWPDRQEVGIAAVLDGRIVLTDARSWGPGDGAFRVVGDGRHLMDVDPMSAATVVWATPDEHGDGLLWRHPDIGDRHLEVARSQVSLAPGGERVAVDGRDGATVLDLSGDGPPLRLDHDSLKVFGSIPGNGSVLWEGPHHLLAVHPWVGTHWYRIDLRTGQRALLSVPGHQAGDDRFPVMVESPVIPLRRLRSRP